MPPPGCDEGDINGDERADEAGEGADDVEKVADEAGKVADEGEEGAENVREGADEAVEVADKAVEVADEAEEVADDGAEVSADDGAAQEVADDGAAQEGADDGAEGGFQDEGGELQKDGPQSEEDDEQAADQEGVLLPKHTIFLSHSGKDKPFVYQLCRDLKHEHYYPFFDGRKKSLPIGEEFPELIKEAARTCLVGVVVLSEDCVTSKWPMVELKEFSDATKRQLKDESTGEMVDNPNYNSSMKLVPVFYKIGPDDLTPSCLDELWEKLIAKHPDMRFDKVKYKEIIKNLRDRNGLKNTFGNNETKYRRNLVTQILKLVPPALPIDTSTIEGCERLCKVIFQMFTQKDPKVRTRKGKEKTCQYLALYGKPGVGKSTICCEAMGHFYQQKHRGRFCRVRLDTEATGASDIAASKLRLARLMTVIKQLVGVPKSMSDIMTELQGQQFLKDRLHVLKQPVFLVVDNVSAASQEEAKWYAEGEFPHDSYVLVTSRRLEVVKEVLEDETYCKPFPTLEYEEAVKLFLSGTARQAAALETEHKLIVWQCVEKCVVKDEYVPRLLTTFASFLKDKGKISGWTEYVDQADSILGHEYHNLDEISKHMILDLAIFASDMRFTHMDFHSELESEENTSSQSSPKVKLAIEFLAMLHDVPYHDAEKKVKNLQGSFLEKISVSEDHKDMLGSVITRNKEVQKWCMLCMDVEEDSDMEDEEGVEYYYDLPPEDLSRLKRVALWRVSFDRDLHRISEWRSLTLLDLYSVQNLPVLDLQPLRSLRVLKVVQCDKIQGIVCTCFSKFSDNKFCYEKKRGCLSELRVVQLEYLRELREASFTKHCRRLATMWFYECPDLAHMPDLQFCRRLKRLRLPCGDFDGFQGLGNNTALTELAFHWETTTVRNFTKEMRIHLLKKVMTFTNLKVLDIVDEKELYDWIPEGFPFDVSGLRNLTFLDLSCSSTIEEIEGLEKLSELTSLGLYGCCKLRRLPKMTSKLRRLCIGHCHSLVPSEGDEDFDIIDISPSISPFHALGEGCSFGAHECLIVKLNIYKEKWENENSEEEDYDEYDSSSDEEYLEEQRHVHESSRLEKGGQVKSDCRQCDPRKWETRYLATNKMIVLSEDPNSTRESIGDREDVNSTKESTGDHEDAISTREFIGDREDVNSTKESTGDHEDANSTRESTGDPEDANNTKESTSDHEDANSTRESTSGRENADSTKESTSDHEDANSTKKSTGDHEDEVLHNPDLDHDANRSWSLGDCEDQVHYKQGGGDNRNQEENYVGGSQSGQQVQRLNNVTTNYISSPLDSFDNIAHLQEGTLDYGQGSLEETANILQMQGAGNIAYGDGNSRGPFDANQFQAEEVNLVQSNAEIVTSYNAEIVTSCNQVLAYFVEDYHLGWW